MQITPMNEFPLKWRWTDEKYCLLALDELEQIKPLAKLSANEVWKKSLTFISNESEFSPREELFENIESTNTEDENKTLVWLTNKMQPSNIIVSWQPDFAVLTNTALFLKYWDEFCYPASDDVSIWPEDESWVIHFHHHELFCYGRARSI